MEILKFAMSGLATTVVDFLVLNCLLRFSFIESRVVANIVSVSCAICVSYVLNSRFVFCAGSDSLIRVAEFVGGSLFSGFVLQSVVLLIGERLLLRCAGSARMAPWMVTNIVKALAIGVGMVWNYCIYRYIVFDGAVVASLN